MVHAALVSVLACSAIADDNRAGAASAVASARSQVERGERLYGGYCAVCHGQRLEASSAMALAGPNFAARWGDGQHSIDDLFYIVRTLMPNDEPGKLTKREYIDIVAYLLRVNGWSSPGARSSRVWLQPRRVWSSPVS